MAIKESCNLIFSMASAYSGHTLTSLFLDTHPRLIDLGDTAFDKNNFQRQVECKCGKSTIDCPFWGPLVDKEWFQDLGAGRVSDVKIVGKLYRLPRLYKVHEKILSYSGANKTVENILKLHDYARKQLGKQKMIYGTKFISQLNAVLAANHQVKIIHYTKHPYLFVSSMSKRKEQSVALASSQWRKYNERVVKASQHENAKGYLHIRYEDLCWDTEGTLQRICRFLGEAYTNMMLNPEGKTHHIIGSNSIVQNKYEGIRDPKEEKSHLSEEEKELVWRIAGKTAMRFGYTHDMFFV